MDSSIFSVLTADDPALPTRLVTDEERRTLRTKRMFLVLAGVGIIAGTLFWVIRYEMPMEQLGAKIHHKAISLLQERLYK